MADHLRDGGAPSYFRPFKTDVFRLDEGYSDETRSQAGSEMRAESRQGQVGMEADAVTSPYLPVLPEWISGLNESERSGMYLDRARMGVDVLCVVLLSASGVV